ncbi:hypothetical protein GCM10023314_30600 [Algibacter agarivorans]|uniref:Replication initiation factor n=1 Tax=Algibacter agarivorans TaxID=1109741 RepID=A0ABP9GVU6_9FLAO
MLDFVKFRIEDKEGFETFVQGNSSLEKSYKAYSNEDGVFYPIIGKLHNMEYRITRTEAIVSGSIHKFYNSINGFGCINYNDFSIKEFYLAIDYLCDTLLIDKTKTTITNLEFGFNIIINKPSSYFIEQSVQMYDFQPYDNRIKTKAGTTFKLFKKSDFSIKIYDKGYESKLEQKNLLRIELKIIQKRFLNKIGINSLDQLDELAVSALFKAFVERYNKMLIVDSISAWNALETHERAFYENYTNPSYWVMLRSTKTSQEIRKDKKRIMSFIKRIGYDSHKNQILEFISTKFNQLVTS